MLLLKLEMPDVSVVERFNVKFENSFGSYFSPIFSNRLRSSSNIDFFVKNDFKISDGLTSFTSSSRNLCRLANVVDAGDGDDDSLSDDCLLVAPPAHISNMPSMVLMRSSNDGLEPSSKSLGLELSDAPTCGLSGGCSIGCVRFDWSKLAVSTGLIFGSAGGAAGGGGFGLHSWAGVGVVEGGGGGMGWGCCAGGCGTLGVVDEGNDDNDDAAAADDDDDGADADDVVDTE